MTALTNDRHTLERTGYLSTHPIATNTLCYAGGLATLTATGYVRPGTVDVSSPTSVAVGRFRRRYDNRTSADNMTASDTAEVEHGIFRWNNYASDAVTSASIQRACYVLDDQTVAATSATGARGPAGIVVDVDSDGVWVATGVPVTASVATAPAIPVYVGNLTLTNSQVLRYVPTRSGVIKSFATILNAAITTNNAIVTCTINGTTVTGGAQTINYSGSAANDTKITTPSALNSFDAGDAILFTVTNSPGGSATAAVTINITEV